MIQKIKHIFISLGLVLFTGRSAWAGSAPGIYSTEGIVHLILLLCAIVGLIWSLKILSLVKGGMMSKSWQMFVLGFCFLVFAQLMALGESAGMFFLPSYIKPSLYLLMAITWLIGLYHTRKVLG